MTAPKLPDLLPCPFCGGKLTRDIGAGGWWHPSEPECLFSQPAVLIDNDMVPVWNTRAYLDLASRAAPPRDEEHAFNCRFGDAARTPEGDMHDYPCTCGVEDRKLARKRASQPPGAAEEVTALEALKRKIDVTLDAELVQMEPNFDDSIVGFNKAWDTVRAILAGAISSARKAALGQERKG